MTKSSVSIEADALRPHVIRGLVVTLAAGAIWHLVGRPLEQGVIDRTRALQESKAGLQRFEEVAATEPDYESMLDTLRKQGTAINAFSAQCPEGSRLYDRFQTLASENHVRILRIEPRGKSMDSKVGRDPRASLEESVGYTIDVAGTYASVGRFIDAIESGLGASKVTSFRITPSFRNAHQASAEDTQAVDATIETNHLRLAIPVDQLAKAISIGVGL